MTIEQSHIFFNILAAS